MANGLQSMALQNPVFNQFSKFWQNRWVSVPEYLKNLEMCLMFHRLMMTINTHESSMIVRGSVGSMGRTPSVNYPPVITWRIWLAQRNMDHRERNRWVSYSFLNLHFQSFTWDFPASHGHDETLPDRWFVVSSKQRSDWRNQTLTSDRGGPVGIGVPPIFIYFCVDFNMKIDTFIKFH